MSYLRCILCRVTFLRCGDYLTHPCTKGAAS